MTTEPERDTFLPPEPEIVPPFVEDRNADLIGFEFSDDRGKTWRVTGSTAWDNGYVLVEADHGTSVRSAELVRRAKETLR